MERGERPGQVLLTRQEFGDCLNIVQSVVDDEEKENVCEFLEELGVDFAVGERLPTTRNGLIVIDEEGASNLITRMQVDQDVTAFEGFKNAFEERDIEKFKAIRDAVRAQRILLIELRELRPATNERSVMSAIEDAREV